MLTDGRLLSWRVLAEINKRPTRYPSFAPKERNDRYNYFQSRLCYFRISKPEHIDPKKTCEGGLPSLA